MLQAVGDSNALVGAGGNDQLQAGGNFNTLDSGIGDDSLFVTTGNQNRLIAGDGNDWLGAGGNSYLMQGGAGNDWMGVTGSAASMFGDDGWSLRPDIRAIYTLSGLVPGRIRSRASRA